MMIKNVTLYRPTGADELALIIDGGMKRFPPRLFWQPIFYPVLNFQYAAEIAEQWNMGDPALGLLPNSKFQKITSGSFPSKPWDSIIIRSSGCQLKA
jgi:hypothetical protein